MDITLINGQRSQSMLFYDVILEYQCSSGVRRRWQQVCRMVEGFAYGIFLGMEWLKRFNLIIDWNSRTIQVQGLNILGCECSGQAAIEVCSWKGMVHTTKYTGNPMFLCLLNEAGKVHTIHKECFLQHYIVV